MTDRTDRETVVDKLAPPSSTFDLGSACLVVIYGEQLGKRLSLDSAAEMTFGRASDCEVVLEDETVSRRHARIVSRYGVYLIEDIGSTNGVCVNNIHVDSRKLGDGDQVKVGRTIFKFLQGGNIEADYHEVIYQMMTNDGLTRAYNRRYFDQELLRERNRASRYGRPLSLIVFDVDHFKQINDLRGHLGGDEVLRQLAGIVMRLVRREDLFARIGGEEFALLLPEGALSGAAQLAERLRATIAAHEFFVEGQMVRVTCSFGVASLDPQSPGSARDLYERADSALYAAKAAGRNCVRM